MELKKLLTPNKGMILIRVIYFFWMFGEREEIFRISIIYLKRIVLWLAKSLTGPYLTLQALGLGLTYEDISIIYGITPIVALAAAPVAGEWQV